MNFRVRVYLCYRLPIRPPRLLDLRNNGTREFHRHRRKYRYPALRRTRSVALLCNHCELLPLPITLCRWQIDDRFDRNRFSTFCTWANFYYISLWKKTPGQMSSRFFICPSIIVLSIFVFFFFSCRYFFNTSALSVMIIS